MEVPKRRRPSPALIVSMVALGGLLAGTAIAGSGSQATTTISKKQAKKIAKRQANRQITKRAPGLDVSSADSAATAVSAGTAASARPFVYAKIKGDGTIDTDVPRRNIGSSQVTNPGTGIYCIALPFTPTSAAATPGGGDDSAMIGLGSQTQGICPAGTDVVVRNWDLGSNALGNESIYIQINN
ncbi:MAG: hypothetical protein WBF18_11735 [Solirubrobacterales bacterium]